MPPSRARREFLYQLSSGPKTGKQIQYELRLKWIPAPGDKRLHRKRGLFHLTNKHHLRTRKIIEHLTWLIEKGYVEWKTVLVPKKLAWRTLLYKKRRYSLTEKGEKYIWGWIRECGF